MLRHGQELELAVVVQLAGLDSMLMLELRVQVLHLSGLMVSALQVVESLQ